MVLKTIEKQKSDGIRINLAGRQRMLTQKLSKEILLYSHNSIQKEEIERTIKIFETTLYALTDGGKAPLELNSQNNIVLPKMEVVSTREQLLFVINLWKNFKSNILNYLINRESESLEYVIHNNVDILNEINKSVFMMQKTSERNDKIIKITLFSTILSILITLVFILTRKIIQLQRASSHISKLESILPICSSCKRIRLEGKNPKDQLSWIQIEKYIHNEINLNFSHGICPECIKKLYPNFKNSKA